MMRWFVVNLVYPRLSSVVDAKDELQAVAISDNAPANAISIRARQLEGSFTLTAATWAVWPVDNLDISPMLVREKCS